MEKLVKIFEDIMVAVTFAEAGQFDEANRIAGNEIQQDETITSTIPAASKATQWHEVRELLLKKDEKN